MNTYYQKLFSLALLLVIPLLGYSQTGPGGVGKADGTGSLRLWLNANKGGTSTGTWNDRSGYGNHLTTPAAPSTNPTLQNTIFGVNRAMRFNMDTQLMTNTTFGSQLNGTPWTVYTAVRHTDLVSNQNILSWGEAADGKRRIIGYDGTAQQFKFDTQGAGNAFITGVSGNAVGSYMLGGLSSQSQVEFRVNGQGFYTYPAPTQNSYANNIFAVGANSDNSLPFKQDIGEVIAFNEVLGTTDRIILENYLAAKYQVSIPLDIDFYNNHAATYNYDVLGVGSINGTEVHPLSSQADTFSIQMVQNSIAGSNVFVFAGTSNTPYNPSSLGNLPATVFDRWAKDYYIDETGTADIKLSFNKAKVPLGGNDYVLLYRNDPSAQFSIVANVYPVVSGDYVIFTIPNANLVDGYYTLGNKQSVIIYPTLYSYASGGDWSSASTWTLDPTGATYNNPGNNIPTANYNATVLPNSYVFVGQNTTAARTLTLNGTLDIAGYVSHTYYDLAGSGRLRLYGEAGIAVFPTVSNSMASFVTATGGTVEYYGTGAYTLPAGITTYNNLVFSDNAAKTLGSNLTLNGSLTIQSTATLNDGNRTINLKGDWTNNGSFVAASTVTFSNTAANQNIFGSTATTFKGLTVAKAAAYSLDLKATFTTVQGTLTLNGGNVVLGKNNLRMDFDAGASFAGSFSKTSMILQNGEGVPNESKLIAKGASNANFQRLYPVGTADYYAPMSITSLTATYGAGAYLTIETIPQTLTSTNYLKRRWTIEGSNVTASASTVSFTYNTTPNNEKVGSPNDVVYTSNAGPAKLANAGAGTTFTATASGIVGDWTLGSIGNIFYACGTGNWETVGTWFTNATCTTPAGAIPTINDMAVIMPSAVVTVTANNAAAADLTVNGTLNLASTGGFTTATDHNFSFIRGTGTIRLSSGNFPTHQSMTDFAKAGAGTVEFYGAGYTINSFSSFPNTVNNLLFNGTNITMQDDKVVVNGNFTINGGASVSDGGARIVLMGNWINGGSFTASQADRSTVQFANTSANQTITGVTEFNRLETWKSEGVNVILNNNISAKGSVAFGMGNIVLGNFDFTLRATGNFASPFSKFQMIQQNNLPNASGGKVLVEGTTASRFYNLVVPIGSFDSLSTNLYYTPVEIRSFNATVGAAGTMSFKVQPYAPLGGLTNSLARYWKIETNNMSGITDSQLKFYYDKGERKGVPLFTGFRSLVQGHNSDPKTHDIASGFYHDDKYYNFGVLTTGNPNLAGLWYLDPVAGSGQTYYSQGSGTYSDPKNDGGTAVAELWNTSRTGTGAFAPTGGPRPYDNIVVQAGHQIYARNWNNTADTTIWVTSTAIEGNGILNLGNATNISLGDLNCSTDKTTYGCGTLVTRKNLPISFSADLSNNPPPTDYTDFVTSGGGTIEFRNDLDFDMPRLMVFGQSTYNNVKVNLGSDNAATTLQDDNKIVMTMIHDHHLNGNFELQRGLFQIQANNKGSADYSSSLKMTVLGFFSVNGDGLPTTKEGEAERRYTNASIRVGNKKTKLLDSWGNSGLPTAADGVTNYHEGYHRLEIHGDFLNKGDIRFTNRQNMELNNNDVTGAVAVFFKGTNPATITMNGRTDFSLIVIEKPGFTTVTFDTDNEANFRIFGRNNTSGVGLVGGSTSYDPNPYSYKALWMKEGTLRLTGKIHIPTLTEGGGNPTKPHGSGDWYVNQKACFMLDGPDVKVYATATSSAETDLGSVKANGVDPTGVNQGISLYGKLWVKCGLLDTRNSSGITLWPEGGSAEILVDGGIIRASQIKAPKSPDNGTDIVTYRQTGGQVFVEGYPKADIQKGSSVNDGNYAAFSLGHSNNVFMMSGGELYINNVSVDKAALNTSALQIESSAANYHVDGGRVVYNLNGSNGYGILSTVPLPNLTINKASTGTSTAIITKYPLIVNDSVTVRTSATLDANSTTNRDLTIGGHFTVHGSYLSRNNTTYFRNRPTMQYSTPPYPCTTTHTAGTQRFEQHFNYMTGSTIDFYNLYLDNTFTTARLKTQGTRGTADIIQVRNDLTLNTSDLEDGGYTYQVQGNIVNNSEHRSTGSGKILMKNSVATVRTVGGDGTGIFGNFDLDDANSARFTANQTITRQLTLTNGVLDINKYNLFLSANAPAIIGAGGSTATTAFNSTRMIKTRGRVSDAGITKAFTAATSYLFPIGQPKKGGGDIYTYFTPTIGSATTYGNFTVRTHSNQHPLERSAADRVIQHYWKVSTTGFSGMAGSVSASYAGVTTNSQETGAAASQRNESNYVAGYINMLGDVTWYRGDNATVIEGTDVVNYGGTLDKAIEPSTGSGAFPIGGEMEGDYTVGYHDKGNIETDDDEFADNAFRAFEAYFSRDATAGVGVADWNTLATWNTDKGTKHAGGTIPAVEPALVNPVFIKTNHQVRVTDNAERAAALLLDKGATLDLQSTTGHFFGFLFMGENTELGTMKISSSGATAQFPGGDHEIFLYDDGGTVEYYRTSTNFTLPTTYFNVSTLDASSNIDTYRKLILNNVATAGTITFGNNNLTVFEDMTTKGTGGNVLLSNTANGNLSVEGSINVNETSTLSFQNNTARFISVTNNVSVNTGATFNVLATGTAVSNGMTIGRDLTNNGTFDMNNGGRTTDVTFVSAVNAFITGTGATTDFNRLIVNKGTDQSYILEALSSNLTLSASSAGAFNTKALELQNGTFKLNNGVSIDINSNNAATLDDNLNFKIPSTAGLWVNNGTITASGTGAADAGVMLDGKIKLTGGNITLTGGTNNFIEYGANSEPEIEVTGGTLTVGSQIRRAEGSSFGGLRYIQTAGEVIVGTKGAPAANNGVFEISDENGAESLFRMTGGKLTLARSNGGGTVADLFLRPKTQETFVQTGTASLCGGTVKAYTGGLIQMGNASTPAAQSFTVDATAYIWDFTIDNSQANTVTLQNNDLRVLDDLTIKTSTTLNANNKDVYIGGDFTNDGIYNYGTNNTVFNGKYFDGTDYNQYLKGTSALAFYKMTVERPTLCGWVTLNKNVDVNNLLALRSGVLYDNNNTLFAKADIYNNAFHTSNGGTGKIVMSSTAGTPQSITGDGIGQFDNIDLDDADDIYLTVPNQFNAKVTFFDNTVLRINKILMTFGYNGYATTSGAGFTNAKMIATEGTVEAKGIKKLIKAGYTGTFLLPYGVFVDGATPKYTPASYEIIKAQADGTITSLPVNSLHPSTSDQYAYTELGYFWRASQTGLGSGTSLSLKHRYFYLQSDVRGDETYYLAARILDNGDGTWQRGEDNPGDVDKVANSIVIDGGAYTSKAGVDFVEGDYTAGYITEFNSLQIFKTVKNGSWDDPTVWDQGVAPTRNSTVYIYHTVTANSNGYDISNAYLFTTAVLDLTNTQGHYFTNFYGSGKMIVRQRDYPNITRDFFTLKDSGTIEYAGANNFAIYPLSRYNKVIFSNTGTVNLSNVDFTVYNDFLISGSGLVRNDYNRNVTFLGQNFTNNGTAAIAGATYKGFYNGSNGSDATFSFERDGNQSLGGSAETNFQILQVNKSSGQVNVSNSQHVQNYLQLTKGVLKMLSTTNSITLYKNAESNQGNATSYVDGYVCKYGATDFVFPLGDADAVTWARLMLSNYQAADETTKFCVDYNSANYTTFGYAEAFVLPIKYVNKFEFWRIERREDTNSDATNRVTMYYEHKPASPDPIWQVHYKSDNKWYKEESTFVSATVALASGSPCDGSVGCLQSTGNWTEYSPGTDGSEEIPLPISLLSFTAKNLTDKVEVKWKTANEVDNSHFIVQRSADGKNFKDLLMVQGAGTTYESRQYTVYDSEPISGTSYYRLADVSTFGDISYSRIVAVNRLQDSQTRLELYPNPTRNELTLYYRANAAEEAQVSITDILGKPVLDTKVQVQKGANYIPLNQEISRLAAGIYIVKVVTISETKSEKLLIQK